MDRVPLQTRYRGVLVPSQKLSYVLPWRFVIVLSVPIFYVKTMSYVDIRKTSFRLCYMDLSRF